MLRRNQTNSNQTKLNLTKKIQPNLQNQIWPCFFQLLFLFVSSRIGKNWPCIISPLAKAGTPCAVAKQEVSLPGFDKTVVLQVLPDLQQRGVGGGPGVRGHQVHHGGPPRPLRPRIEILNQFSAADLTCWGGSRGRPAGGGTPPRPPSAGRTPAATRPALQHLSILQQFN